LRGHLSPEEYQEQTQRVIRDIATGVYSFGSQAAYTSLQSLPHLRQLFLLMLADNHPKEATPELVARMFEHDLEACTQAMTAANADPNSPPPAAG
jgi:hypothetical protein